MATMVVPKAKLQIDYEDVNGVKFSETPFYLDVNVIGNQNIPTGNTTGSYQNHTPQQVYDKIMTCVSQLDSLTTGTFKAAKLVYDVELK